MADGGLPKELQGDPSAGGGVLGSYPIRFADERIDPLKLDDWEDSVKERAVELYSSRYYRPDLVMGGFDLDTGKDILRMRERLNRVRVATMSEKEKEEAKKDLGREGRRTLTFNPFRSDKALAFVNKIIDKPKGGGGGGGGGRGK